MSKLKYLVMAIIALVMTSCGGKEKAGEGKEEAGDYVTLEIQETNMGSFSNYGSFSGEVKLKLNATEEKTEEGSEYFVSIPLTITSDVAWKYNLRFQLTVADEDYSTIEQLGYFIIHGEHDFDSDYDQYLVSGDVRQDFKVRLTDEEWKAIQEGGKYLVIMSKTDSDNICSHDGSKTSSFSDPSDNDDDDSFSSSGDEDWDAILDSYEEYVNNYISLLKKAKNGDMDALSEYPTVMENAQELSEKLQNAQGSMSSSQLSRYTKITTNMTEAAASMN